MKKKSNLNFDPEDKNPSGRLGRLAVALSVLLCPIVIGYGAMVAQQPSVTEVRAVATATLSVDAERGLDDLYAEREQFAEDLAEMDARIAQADEQQQLALLRERQQIENDIARNNAFVNDEEARINLRATSVAQGIEATAAHVAIDLTATADTHRAIAAATATAISLETTRVANVSAASAVVRYDKMTRVLEVALSALAVVVVIAGAVALLGGVGLWLYKLGLAIYLSQYDPMPEVELIEAETPPAPLAEADLVELMREFERQHRPTPADTVQKPANTVPTPPENGPSTDEAPISAGPAPVDTVQESAEFNPDTVERLDPKQAPTAAQRAMIRGLYNRYKSKSQVARMLYGSKNPKTFGYVTKSVEEGATLAAGTE